MCERPIEEEPIGEHLRNALAIIEMGMATATTPEEYRACLHAVDVRVRNALALAEPPTCLMVA